jgi:hypothetical protein
MDFLQEIYTFFRGNPTLNIISLLLGISGLILSFYFYSKSKKSRKPVFIIRTINLIKESLNKIETVNILYGTNKIDNLSISKIAFWNDGRETINSTDIASLAPICVVISSEYEILDAEIIFQKNVANNFQISISDDRKSVNVNFEYFDFEEGIVLQIAHTGNSSNEIDITGTVKSVKKIKRKELITSIIPFRRSKILTKKGNRKIKKRIAIKMMGWMMIIFGLLGLCTLSIDLLIPKSNIEIPQRYTGTFKTLPIIAISLLYLWIGIRILKRRIPPGFDVFDEEF